MSKVKLTQKQAVIIESLKKEHLEMLKELYEHPENYDIGKLEPLMDLTAEQYHEALYDGYEIEEEYKVGDWVVNANGSIGVIERITNAVYSGKWWNGKEKAAMLTYESTFERHATTEEIAEFKMYEWWRSNDRDPWELRKNDLLIDKDGDTWRVTKAMEEIHLEFYPVPLDAIKNRFKVACFAEDRKDIKK